MRLRARSLITAVAAAFAVSLLGAPAATAADPITEVALENATNGKCVDLPGYDRPEGGTPFSQYTCDDTKMDNQRFLMQPQGTRSDGRVRYLIRVAGSNWCLDVPGRTQAAQGSAVTTSTCNAGSDDNMVWYAQKGAKGWLLKNEKSKRCLTPAVHTGLNDTRLIISTCNLVGDQNWKRRAPRMKIVGEWVPAGCGASGKATVRWGANAAQSQVHSFVHAGGPLAVTNTVYWTTDMGWFPDRYISQSGPPKVWGPASPGKGIVGTVPSALVSYGWSLMGGQQACVEVWGYKSTY